MVPFAMGHSTPPNSFVKSVGKARGEVELHARRVASSPAGWKKIAMRRYGSVAIDLCVEKAEKASL